MGNAVGVTLFHNEASSNAKYDDNSQRSALTAKATATFNMSSKAQALSSKVTTTLHALTSGKASWQTPLFLRGVSFKVNFFLLEQSVSSGTFSYGTIDRTLLQLCEDSWIKIVSNYKFPPSGPKEKTNIHIFFDTFFKHFEQVDVDCECLPKFCVQPRSYIPNRDALLLRIIKYFLSVPNDSFKVKTKLRSLGRAHARRGIVEKHFRVFCQALMMTFVESLGSSATNLYVTAWMELLSFVVHQMSFDKVFFIPRTHQVKDFSVSFAEGDKEESKLEMTPALSNTVSFNPNQTIQHTQQERDREYGFEDALFVPRADDDISFSDELEIGYGGELEIVSIQ